MGSYSYNSRCYQDDAAVLAGFRESFPKIEGSSSIQLTQSSMSGSVISYGTYVVDLKTGAVGGQGTLQLSLSPCTPTISQWDISVITWIAALFFACFLGFRSGYRP